MSGSSQPLRRGPHLTTIHWVDPQSATLPVTGHHTTACTTATASDRPGRQPQPPLVADSDLKTTGERCRPQREILGCGM